MGALSSVTGQGSPVVLLGGGLRGSLTWTPHEERLVATRKVVRVQNLCVHLGLEGRPLPPDFSPQTEVQSLLDELEDLGLQPPVDFVGWSAGAIIALELTVDHPYWARTLTLIEPGGYWLLPSMDDDAKRERDEELKVSRYNITEDDLERFVQRVKLVPAGANPRELPQWPEMVRHRQSLRVLPYVAEYHRDTLERLHGLTCPVLLVKGTGSVPYLHRIIDALAERLPNAQVVEWPGGHAPHLVSMGPFLERLDEFHAAARSA